MNQNQIELDIDQARKSNEDEDEDEETWSGFTYSSSLYVCQQKHTLFSQLFNVFVKRQGSCFWSGCLKALVIVVNGVEVRP